MVTSLSLWSDEGHEEDLPVLTEYATLFDLPYVTVGEAFGGLPRAQYRVEKSEMRLSERDLRV